MANTNPTEQAVKKPWFKKKRVMIPLVLFLLVVAIGAAGGGGEEGDDSQTAASTSSNTQGSEKTTTTAAAALYPGRADRQKDDQEVAAGGSTDISGYTVTANGSFQQSITEYEKDGYVVATVTLKNRDAKAQPFNVFDWRIQTPGGQVVDPTFTSIDGALQSGDLVKDGTVTGKIVYKVGGTKGDHYLIYKPDAFNDARAIWKVTV